MVDAKRARAPLGAQEQVSAAFALVAFNQGLIQFADGKANGLVLVSSIFLASMVPFLAEVRAPGAASEETRVVLVLFFVSSVSSLLASLAVIASRSRRRPGVALGRGLLLFSDILEHPTADDYVEEFRRTDPDALVRSLVASNHHLASIASAKFRAYGVAQALTFATAGLWIAAIVLHVVGRR